MGASACWPGVWRSGECVSCRCRTATPENYWDQHSKLREKHQKNALKVDKPIAGLLKDLKSRGLLEDTLVIFGTEFGRSPAVQGKDGRDHNPTGFTIWMAGGGVRPGIRYGATDEFGWYAVENKMTFNDFHATVLHLMGLDHTRLTYRHAGRDFRLTDVAGEVPQENPSVVRRKSFYSPSVLDGLVFEVSMASILDAAVDPFDREIFRRCSDLA